MGSGDTVTAMGEGGSTVGRQAGRLLFGWCLHHGAEPGALLATWARPVGVRAEAAPDRPSEARPTMTMSDNARTAPFTNPRLSRPWSTVGGDTGGRRRRY